MKRVRDKLGVNVRNWSPEMLDAYRKAWDEVVAEESKAIAEFRKV
jgi:TRAP-type mannitol/chloroaromatic compound transport system substrate-binding protein